MKAPAPLVFFDIAGPDDDRQRQFYAEVFGWTAGVTGAIAAPIEGTSLRGTLRTDPADKVLYIGVDDITATLAEVEQHGGTMLAPRFEVPGVVVLGLFTDPAGNRLGLVELQDGRPRVP